MPISEVVMERLSLESLPVLVEPAGWGVRAYQSGDDVNWTTIQTEADRYNVIGRDLFWHEFGRDKRDLSERVLFVWNTVDGVVGTAAAWWGSSASDPWGRVHWVAVRPSFQRRSLGRTLVVAVCHRLRELGHKHAYLTTATVRHEAIRLYLKLGFLPQLADVNSREVWSGLAIEMGDSTLNAFLKSDG